MHILQPKHIKLKQEELEKLLTELNIPTIKLRKIKILILHCQKAVKSEMF